MIAMRLVIHSSERLRASVRVAGSTMHTDSGKQANNQKRLPQQSMQARDCKDRSKSTVQPPSLLTF